MGNETRMNMDTIKGAIDILKIGVTGSAGSGKSLVCQGFKSLGLVTLDCDKIARQVVEPGQKAYAGVIDCFGPGVLRKDKTLDRAKLRNLMIHKPDLRKQLEALLHPIILEEMVLQMENAAYDKEAACAVEVPLLFESGMENKFNVTVTVVAEKSELLERISRRDKVSTESAGKMLDLQMTQDEKIKKADYVITNKGTPVELFESVQNCYGKIKKEFLTINI